MLPTTTQALLPTPVKAARLPVVDALRGIALLGILVVHCSRWFTADALPARLYRLHGAGALNALVIGKVELLLVDKFYTIFSFLFGLSFALMLGRSHEAPGVFYRRYARRLGVLAGIGLLHYLHWRGDILLIYAVLGGLLLLFSRASNGVVLAFGCLLALNLPVTLGRAYAARAATPLSPQTLAIAKQQALANYQTLTHGSYADTVVANAHSFGHLLDFQLGTGRVYHTLGFFLLGLYAGRRRLFEQLADKRALFWRLGLGALLALVATKIGIVLLTNAYGPAGQATAPAQAGFALVYDIRNVTTTLFYLAGLTLFFQYRAGRWAVPVLALVGRMALTNYLLQTLMGSLLFFGYGLGLQGTSQLWVACLLSLPIFGLQVAFSAWWLAHFRFGPVEWAWRSLTLGQRQPLRLAPA
ncbi:DUF418 domain-containing protein [Hymenobacter psoromatis]|uniref:DUF418 domain-containing protein n=1 Tax=Hymenobacter psoromatis TaxID=1484116 RepID=UPI001CBDCAA0|nr:DUF418 domain-containing protein [Hymenobacter psoromatis]